MEPVRAARKPIRAKFTRTVNELKPLLAVDNPDEEEIELKMERLRISVDDLQQLDDKILNNMLAADCLEDEYQAEHDVIDKYRDEWSDICVKVRRTLHKPVKGRSPSPSEYDTASGRASTAGSESSKKRSFKLPKIELKKFGGEITEWLSWWAQFSKIHEDEELHTTDKFQYLLQSTIKDSRARELVESYPMTALNYPKVIKALQDRFGKEKILRQVYVRELLKIVMTNAKSKEKQQLSKVYDKLESHLRALETLGVTAEQTAEFLFPMVESSLPEDILVAWQRCPLHGQDGSKLNPPKSELDFLMEFLRSEMESEEQRKLARAGFESTGERDKKKTEKSVHKKEEFSTAAGLFSGKSSVCIFCDKGHPSQDCFRAQQMTLKEKNDKCAEKKACFKCLRTGHLARDCNAKVKCILCFRKHVTTMCPDLFGKKKDEVQADNRQGNSRTEGASSTTAMTSHECSGDVLLQTLLVRFYNEDKSDHRVVRLLFDNGSQGTSVRRDTTQDLGLQPISQVWASRVLFGGQLTERQKHNKFQITLTSLDGNTEKKLIALDELEICGRLRRIPSGPWIQDLRRKKIWLSDFQSDSPEIDILVGSDYFGQLMTGRIVHLKCGLTAIETVFGWTLSGRVPDCETSAGTLCLSSAMMICQSSLSDLWSLEALGIMDPAEVKDKQGREEDTKKHFLETVSRNEEGRFSVKLPWIDGGQLIPNNKSVAEKRLISTTAKLVAANKYEVYDGIFKQWLKEGFIEEVSENGSLQQGKEHYLPHRPVFKPESVTTPVRPVFDASCKTGRNPSLNDCLEKGPNLLELIPSILLRFREKKVGVISDVRKAFQMIEVDELDRDVLRFLWWEDKEQKIMKVFRHVRVVFGVNCSPFLLGAVIEHLLKSVKIEDQPVAIKLLRSLYVDNCVTSVDSIEEYQHFKEKSIQILADAKMELRQWEYNSVEEFRIGPQPGCGLNYDSSCILQALTTVLGLKWNKMDDTLRVPVPLEEISPKITKRVILSQVQKIYDPMGFLSPATLVPKLMLQKTWEKKASWDSEVEDEIKKEFMDWWMEITDLEKIHIPRYAFGNSCNYQIHTFCDASRFAYAAIVFLRVDAGGEVSVQLLQSKSRVAPIKKITIPRLELLGCTVASRLTETVKEALSLQAVPTFYWCDSTTALAWIRRNDEWGTFVGNRVKEICRLTKVEQWSHVPGVLNPADLPSRGCSPSALLESRWWEGPDWLKRARESWPSHNEEDVDEEAVNAEKKRKPTTAMIMESVEEKWYLRRYSSYSKNLRLLAWMLRFISRCRHTSAEFGKLTVDEVNHAERTLVKIVQNEVFPLDKSIISGLRVCKSEDGMLLVKTKLLNREDSELFKKPFLLPNCHPLVDQLLRENHILNGHAGIQFLIGQMREKFWIIQARKAVRSMINNCVICQRFQSKATNVPEAPLPEDRVKSASVFQITGVDLAGPLFLKNGTKTWFVIFTCAVYRAIHLELISSCSTDAFLLAFFRFVSRRGRPTTMYSDNGLNFVGANNLFAKMDWNRIAKESEAHRIHWIFNPPSASWWGGFWERLIRSVKDLLKRMLGRKKLNYEELSSCLCEAEAVVNGRPLTFVTEDQDDLIPLTPAMFIQDITSTDLPEVEALDGIGLRKKYKDLKFVRAELRERFRKEYLALLIHKGKDKKVRALEVGDLVLMGSDNQKRLDWPMGRIIKLHPGKDNEIRVATVKTMSGVFLRPLQRLFPLEISSKLEIPPVGPKVMDAAKKKKERVQFQESDVVTRFGRNVKKPVRFGV